MNHLDRLKEAKHIADTNDFNDFVLYIAKSEGCSYKESYEIAEQYHKELNGRRRFASYESWKINQHSKMKRKK